MAVFLSLWLSDSLCGCDDVHLHVCVYFLLLYRPPRAAFYGVVGAAENVGARRSLNGRWQSRNSWHFFEQYLAAAVVPLIAFSASCLPRASADASGALHGRIAGGSTRPDTRKRTDLIVGQLKRGGMKLVAPFSIECCREPTEGREIPTADGHHRSAGEEESSKGGDNRREQGRKRFV